MAATGNAHKRPRCFSLPTAILESLLQLTAARRQNFGYLTRWRRVPRGLRTISSAISPFRRQKLLDRLWNLVYQRILILRVCSR